MEPPCGFVNLQILIHWISGGCQASAFLTSHHTQSSKDQTLVFCILFSDNILFLIINITYCGKFAKYKKAQKHKEESFGYIILMQCFNSLPAVSQLTHIVIVLPQTLVACFHFSTFLLCFALFFLCSAPIPSCTLPSLYSVLPAGLSQSSAQSSSGALYTLKDQEAASFPIVMLLIWSTDVFPGFIPSITGITIDQMLNLQILFFG